MASQISRVIPAAQQASAGVRNRRLAWREGIGRFPYQRALAASAVFAVPFVLFYRLILFHFYVRGSFLLDSGLLAALMWHNSTALLVPSSLGGFSFFAQHVAPVLVLVSAASYWLPLTLPQLFAAFIGLCHGILALAVFWLLVGGWDMRRGLVLAVAALAGVGFACNGLAIAIVRYPHFETFGAACLLMFFVALVLQRRTIAVISFLFALATREDVGLHAFGFLTVWIALNRLRGMPWQQSRWIIGFAVAGLTYSTVVLFAQHQIFPQSSAFVRVYLGDPPWSQVSFGLLATRLSGWLWLHCAIIFPAAATVAWSVRRRNPYALAGYVACIPWAVMHLLAVSDHAGLMVGYYAYPFLIAMVWPWLAERIVCPEAPLPPMAASGWLLAMVALSLVPTGADFDPGRITLPQAFLQTASASQQALTDRTVAAIAAARPKLGRLVVDTSVAALLPSAFSRDELVGDWNGSADTVVWFKDGFDAKALQATSGLAVHVAVPGTMIRIMTDRPEAALRELGIMP